MLLLILEACTEIERKRERTLGDWGVADKIAPQNGFGDLWKRESENEESHCCGMG